MFLKVLLKVALVLVIVGAINWGLVGIFDFNLVTFLFDGISPVITRICYIVIGIAGLISVINLFLPLDRYD